MSLEELNRQFEPIYRANPDAVKSYMETITNLVLHAIDGQTGVFSDEILFDEVRPFMPNAADLGVCPALADGIARMIIGHTIERLSRPPLDADTELAMLNRIGEVMEKRGFKTAGEAIADLRKQQIN